MKLTHVRWDLRWLICWGAGALGCGHEIEETPSLIDRPRVLVVVADPPEARPLQSVEMRAVVAAPLDGDEPLEVDAWTFCVSARVPGSTSSVSPACRSELGSPLGAQESSVSAVVPADACRRFGPDPPPGDFRPQDPDATGGFHQPVRLEAFGALWFHLLRLRCPLPHAPAESARAYATEYRDNENPVLVGLSLGGETAQLTPLDTEPSSLTLRAGSEVDVEVSWAPDSAESYPFFEPSARRLVERTEHLTVSLHATGGEISPAWQEFPGGFVGAAQARWALPPRAGRHRLWVVLRDSRGGSAVVRADVVVQ